MTWLYRKNNYLSRIAPGPPLCGNGINRRNVDQLEMCTLFPTPPRTWTLLQHEVYRRYIENLRLRKHTKYIENLRLIKPPLPSFHSLVSSLSLHVLSLSSSAVHHMAKAKAARRTLDSYAVKHISKTIRREFCSSWFSNYDSSYIRAVDLSVFVCLTCFNWCWRWMNFQFIDWFLCYSRRLPFDAAVGVVKAFVCCSFGENRGG